MCGIGGFVRLSSGGLPDKFNEFLMHTFDLLINRGPDSFGISKSNGVLNSLKFTNLANSDYKEQTIEFLKHGSGLDDLVLFAFRGIPTTEANEIDNPDYVQPYIVPNKGLVVHNGIIANDKELVKINGYPYVDVDSYVIIHHLSNSATNLDFFCEDFISGSAFVFFDLVRDRLVFYRNFKGLYFGIWDDGRYKVLIWSSENLQLLPHSREVNFICREMPSWSQLVLTVRQLLQFFENRSVSSSSILDYLLDNCNRYRASNTDKCAVILSGGLDSTTVAMQACLDYDEIYLLHFLYGSRAQKPEEISVIGIYQYLQTKFPNKTIKLEFIKLDFLKNLGGSSLTDITRDIAVGEKGAETTNEWVPARNNLFIALTASYCDKHDIGVIMLGTNLEEGSVFEDNSVEYHEKLVEALDVGTKSRPKIYAPLIRMMKHHIVDYAYKIEAPIHLSWSCYYGGVKPCGLCGPDFNRLKAHLMTNRLDMLDYEALPDWYVEFRNRKHNEGLV